MPDPPKENLFWESLATAHPDQASNEKWTAQGHDRGKEEHHGGGCRRGISQQPKQLNLPIPPPSSRVRSRKKSGQFKGRTLQRLLCLQTAFPRGMSGVLDSLPARYSAQNRRKMTGRALFSSFWESDSLTNDVWVRFLNPDSMGTERFRGARSIELLRLHQMLKVVFPGMVRVREEIVGSRLFDALVFANP